MSEVPCVWMLCEVMKKDNVGESFKDALRAISIPRP